MSDETIEETAEEAVINEPAAPAEEIEEAGNPAGEPSSDELDEEAPAETAVGDLHPALMGPTSADLNPAF